MAEMVDPGFVNNIPGWVQIVGNVAVFATITASTAFAYIRTRVGSNGGGVEVAGADEHSATNRFIVKALEIMERTATAQERTAIAAQAIAASVAHRDQNAEIDRRINERFRHNRQDHGEQETR